MANFVFAISVPAVVIFCLSPMQKFYSAPEKSGIGWYSCAFFFLVIMWPLARNDHRNNPTLQAKQTRFIYGWWLVWVTIDLATIFILRWRYNAWDLSEPQLLMIKYSSICFAVTLFGWFIAWRIARVPIANYYVRSAISVSWKTVSQMVLAWVIWQYGRGDIVLTMLVTGMLTILARLAQIILSVKVDGWTHQRRAMAISEILNLLSWALVAFVWGFST